MPIQQVINNKLECDFKEIEKHLDSSFDNINNFIDEVFTLGFPISKFNNQISEFQLPKVDQFILIDQSKFQSKIVQELTPLINSKIIHQVQISLQSDQDHQYSLKKQSLSQSQLKQENEYQIKSSIQFNLKPFTYERVQHNYIELKKGCYAVAFNKDCSNVAVGCDKQIKIFEFRYGMLKQIQVLNQHKSNVNTFRFMKKSNQFISGDYGGQILIWSSNHNNQWICSQTSKGHNNWINCLIMNNNEDIIISSSYDKTIKYWIKQYEWICQQTITDHTNDVLYQVQMNYKIKLFHVDGIKQYYKKWMVIQNIKVDCQGLRLCFINDNLFTFQPYKGNLMYVYEMNSVSKKFKKIKNITINKGDDSTIFFPQQYIKSKQLIVCKHDQYINIIRMTENNKFKVEQSIQFDNKFLYGQMSDDGEYLIIWDDSSQELLIRKYTEK